ncbi:MAG: phosphoglycerate kinase [Armatimonadota bacterium]
MSKQTVQDIDVLGKRVLVRVDFNVPQDDDGTITDDRRIAAAIPTLKALIDGGAQLIVMSHLGRPKGKIAPKYSLAPVAARLGELIGVDVHLAASTEEDPLGITTVVPSADYISLLENTRFTAAEEANEADLSSKLATLADVCVNDAFGAAHRAHASTEGVATVLRAQGKPCVAGLLMDKEIAYLGGALTTPARPFVAILGGAKVKDKIKVIDALLPKVDSLIVGGGMSYTFNKAAGHEIGKSLLDSDSLEYCAGLLGNDKLVLPVDVVVAGEFSNDAPSTIVPNTAMPADQEGLDIGPETIEKFASVIRAAKTVVWNGPMGVFEMPNFAKGTKAIADAMADATAAGAITIVGGGDSAAAVEQLGYADRMSHISTGGGASLEFLEGRVLPGLAALDNKE